MELIELIRTMRGLQVTQHEILIDAIRVSRTCATLTAELARRCEEKQDDETILQIKALQNAIAKTNDTLNEARKAHQQLYGELPRLPDARKLRLVSSIPSYGYTRDEEGHVIPDIREQEVINLLVKMRKEKKKYSEIIKTLDSKGYVPRNTEKFSASFLCSLYKRITGND